MNACIGYAIYSIFHIICEEKSEYIRMQLQFIILNHAKYGYFIMNTYEQK